MKKLVLAFLFLLTSYFSIGQTGPGGVGNSTGSSGQPQNVLWLRGNSGISTTGVLVDTWVDQSGNSNNATGTTTTRPTYNATDANFNSRPSITFPNTAASNFFLQVADNDNLDNTSGLSIFFIARPSGNAAATQLGIVSKRITGSSNQSYLLALSTAPRYQGLSSGGSLFNFTSVNTVYNQLAINSFVFSSGNIVTLENGNTTTFQNGTGTNPIPNNASNLFIGTLDNAGNANFEGEIAEVIIYKTNLNVAQRQIVENYLASQYNATLFAAADFYVGDTPGNGNYDFDLAGIGFNGGGSHVLGNSQGFILSPSGGTLDTNGEFVLAAHNDVTNAVSISNLGTGGVVQRWARGWYLDRTPAAGIDANITFDFSEGIAGQFPQSKDNYVLLKLNTGTGNYDVVSAITSGDKTLVGDQITFRVADANLVDGVYTLGTLNSTTSPVNGVSNRTWYSYQSGIWTDPLSWTLDGGVFPLYVNPSNEIPAATDNVVVTTARTITMNINNAQTNSMEVIGNLDLAATTGHNFVAISGSGRIKMAGSTDNFPSGTATDFASSAIGGTLEINGTGISLNQARTFNHVEINMTGGANIATLENNYTINGNLVITNGIVKFNNDADAISRTCTVNGNVFVSSSGGIRTGLGNARHEFNLYGDFTNDGGTAYFTQRVVSVPNSEATDGIVDVNMLSGSRDQSIACDGVTRFYRIEISKGTDDTYKASITASAAANFNLFGYINEAHGNIAQLVTNANALGLIYGTAEIGTNVSFDLNNTGNYNVSQGARLWINGGAVTKSAGTAIVVYGVSRVSSGTLTANIDSGITLRDNGTILTEGGTLTLRAIRTSTNGAGAVGSYIQSGGDVILTGGTVSVDYAVLSLTYTGNVFNMSGGTLTVQNRVSLGTGNLRGAIFINSDPANISVTGGTVIMEADNAINYRVTSRAAFWNVIMRATGGSRVFELLGTTSGQGTAGVDELTLAIQPLTVLNDFTIENNAGFTTTNADVTVSRNFEIQNGGTYTSGTNTTTITGSGVSSLTFGNTAVTQTFNNLIINKTSATDQAVITSGRPSPNSAIRVDGNFTLSKGIFDYGSFIVSARTSVTLGNVIVGSGTSTGKLLMDGIVDQTLNSNSSALVYNLELNNTDGTPVVTLASGNLTILNTLTMTAGVFNIGTFKLTLSGATASIAGTGFSASKMIQTSANSSDGGLELYLNANETLAYPLGVAGKYTPVTATFTSFSDDGFVRIAPVNGILQTTNLAGGTSILAYYWRVGSSNFTTKPLVTYQFTYESGDVGGTEANYVPGKVLDVSPFTRSFENDVTKVDDATNVITFNGAGAGFTLEDANYTAGETGRFTGSPEIYYSRGFGDAAGRAWTDVNNWTLGTNGAFGVHDSRQTAAADYPQVGDVAIVGFVPFGDPAGNNGRPHGVAINTNISVAELQFNQMKDISNNPTARVYAFNFQFRPTVCINNLGTQGQLLNAKVSGEGMFWIRSTGGNLSDPTFAGVDLGAFNLQDSSYVVYESTLATANYVNTPSTYPNLMMATDGWGTADKSSTIPNNITVNGDLELLGDINLVLSTGATGNITVNRKLRFFRSNANGNDSGGGGEIRFGNTGTARTITVLGDLVLGNGYAALINIPSPGVTPITHTFNLSGNFYQNTTAGNGFKAGTSSTNDRIHVNLLGSSSMVLSNTAGDAPQFYTLTVNKGSSIVTTATFNSNFSINGPTNLTTKSLVLQNGLFIMNHATPSVVLTSGGADFNIPSSAGLEVRLGTVSTTTASTNANITLDGLLRISGGTATIDAGAGFPNYIEYSNSGNATIEVTGGTLTVGGQVRRSLSSTTGILKYSQTNGTVVIGNRGAPATTRGVFEVLNTGSLFFHSGGSFTLVQGINSTTVPSLWLEPASSTITSGSTITIGNASTPANSLNIGIQSTVALNNLTIAGSNNPVAKIYITPLTVNGNMMVSSATTLNANSQNLTIGGNFTVDGSYVPTTNTTTFTNTGAAAISGTTPLFNFYNFTKTGAGTTTVSKDLTINQDLKVLGGILASSTFTINLKRHAQIDATLTNTTGSGLIFNGAVQQQLTRTASGTGTFGIVTVNNALGVIVPDGNGYTFDVTTGLRLQQGVFDIGGALLFLRTNAIITPVNAFSITNMIQTNSSFTDKGVKKQFPTSYTLDFTFPVGQLAYTPVIFNFSTAGNTTGTSGTPTITVRPANERHPSVINDDGAGELPDPATFNDLNNVLQYHWIVNADNVANTFRSTMTLSYPQSVVSVVAPYTEADYLAARILLDANPTKLINKFTTTDVDETTNIITFNFTGVTDAGISAEYFAGVDVAIPDNVPIYTTIASGNVNAAVYTPVVPGGGAPTGATVIVSPGHNLTFNISNVSLYETQINAGATVTIPTGSTGHRLGTLTGTGDLRINSDINSASLPAAVYDDFFSCSGGGLIFGGAGTYTIMGGVTTVRSLTLFGAGTKYLGNNDVTICNDLTLNAGGLNTDGRTLTVLNDFNLVAGTYNVSTSGGILSVTQDLNSAGIFNGGNAGAKTIGRNLNVTAGTFTPGSGATNIMRVNGNMSVADAATITSGSSSHRFLFGGSAAQTATGTFTGTRAFNRLEINNTSGLTLAGNTTINTELILTAGNITPGANTLLLNASATSNPAEGSITSFVNGRLYKVFAAAGNSFAFPIGSATFWRSGAVKSVSASGTWDMEFIGINADVNETIVTNMTPVAPIVRISTGGYWVVTDGSGTPSGKTAIIGLSWGVGSDVNASAVERQDLRVVQWDDGTSQWTNKGGTNFSAGNTQSRGTFDATSTTSFSRKIVTLGSIDVANPLPVSFLAFMGRTENGVNILRWSTASEKNNDYFELERSIDNAETFELIGTLAGKGTSQTLSSYTFEDREAQIGKNYYRLKQVDFDGTITYHPDLVLLELESKGDFLDFDVFPNPVEDQLINLKIFKNNNEPVQIRFYDVNGKICLTHEDSLLSFQLQTDRLSSGVYIIEIVQGFRRVTKRVVIKD